MKASRTHVVLLLRPVQAALIIGFFTLGTLGAQEAKSVLVPLRPAELLGALPAPPEGWRLTASNAKHLPQSRPLSRAYREYVPPADSMQPGVPAGTPKMVKIKITIVDTAGNSNLSAFLAGTETAAGTKRLTVDSMPALRTEVPGLSDHLEVLALQRFLITIDLAGAGNERADEWVKRLNLDLLKKAASRAEYFDPKKEYVLTVESVDELDQRRNRKSKWALGHEEEEPSPTP